MELFAEILNSYIMPFMLILSGFMLAYKIKLHRILSPRAFFKTLADSGTTSGVSPVKAMCTALAGTLGVGNIAGVATAITAGGAGAIMWMWIGSAVSMSIKYSEVALAIKYRRKADSGYIGGAMYTMRDGMSRYIGKRKARLLGGVFALLCIVNSLLMGNAVQTNAAASVFASVPKEVISVSFAAVIIIVSSFGAKKLCNVTFALIPPLSALYIILSVSVICRNVSYIPEVFCDIASGAFSVKSAVGGAVGFGMAEALRYGITRGIFSNEAGCGTSPTAHASADTKSPHHQGCFGIFEVIADTPVLCTMTALAILIAEKKHPTSLYSLDGVPLSLASFGSLLGKYAYYLVGISVILFALATVIAQLFYGKVALGYFTASKKAAKLFAFLSVAACLVGAVMPAGLMWTGADITVGVMTTVNTAVLIVMRREVADIASLGLNNLDSDK